jgi:hypothetical protein
MTDFDLMLEQLDAASAADLAALAAALRVPLVKLRYPVSLVKLPKPAEPDTEEQLSFMWGPRPITLRA